MKKLLIISSFFLILIIFSVVGYKIVSADSKIEEENSIIQDQELKEKYLTPYGYTLDNPNIVKDPYNISPLTALIMFETKEDEEITIIIKGKDKKSTYKNTFKKEKKHYIPIYGLYQDYNNEIILKTKNQEKKLYIKTDKIPKINIKKIKNDTNKLYFITENNNTYAIDNNNEIRWYLNYNNQSKIKNLKNGNLIITTNEKVDNIHPKGLLEIDLLGKIYHEYDIPEGYYNGFIEKENTIVIQSNKIIEINKETGKIAKSKETEIKEQEAFYLPVYNINNYEIKKGVYFINNNPSEEAHKNITIINYKKIDNNYKNHNIKITKEQDRIKVQLNKEKKENIYFILDKFLEKKVYKLNNETNYITNKNLKEDYSIYIKIDNILYKTNKYVNFKEE